MASLWKKQNILVILLLISIILCNFDIAGIGIISFHVFQI